MKVVKETIPLFGFGLIESAGNEIKENNTKKALIVYDVKAEKHALAVKKSINEAGILPVTYLITAGEKEKNLLSAEKILSVLYENDFAPSDCVVAVGGGATSDLAGFVASVYKRGISFHIVPTTLLAAVDSAFGGKTAVDIGKDKNVIGTFYPAKKVLVDFGVLRSLLASVYSDGYGEILKYALLSEEIFALVCGKAVIFDVVKACVNYKLSVVQKDFYDERKRRVLNLGHTVAHAIESLSGFKVSHGKAVGQGLYFVTELSYRHGIMEKSERDKILFFLSAYGVKPTEYGKKDLAFLAAGDKKVRGDYINLVLLEKIGMPVIKKIKTEKLAEFYEY